MAVNLKHLANSILRANDSKEIVGSSLWDTQPTLIVLLRRPGCILCRDEASKVWAMKPELDKLGVGMVCVVHEWIQREVTAFTPAFWGGQVYHDIGKDFYKVLGGGNVVSGSLLPFLNPFSESWKKVREAQKNIKDHNLVGDGMSTMGGILVVAKGGDVQFMHVERSIGQTADHAEIMKAVEEVAKLAKAQQ
ncbi:MAG: hypothetical protein WDW38_007208 [Sanguina aurantia]